MPAPEQPTQAALLRAALGADRVCYWRTDDQGVAHPWEADPPDCLQVSFNPQAGRPAQEFATGPAGNALLPLALRATVPESAAIASLRCGSEGGIFAIWDNPADVPPQREAIATFARGVLEQQLNQPSRVDLNAAERRFSTLVEALPQGVLFVPVEQANGYANAAAARLLGIQPGQVQIHVLSAALHAFAAGTLNAGEVRSQIGMALSYGATVPAPCIWRFGRAPTALRVTHAPLGPLGGEGWVWLFDDISIIDRAQEALRLSDERWQYALENAHQGVYDWNIEQGTVFFSRTWLAMLGIADARWIGTIAT